MCASQIAQLFSHVCAQPRCLSASSIAAPAAD
jgi:hypothetical protein